MIDTNIFDKLLLTALASWVGGSWFNFGAELLNFLLVVAVVMMVAKIIAKKRISGYDNQQITR